MIVMLMWLAAPAVRFLRLSYGRSVSRPLVARMPQRQLRDIGLMATNQQRQHLHFANAEAQLGMIR